MSPTLALELVQRAATLGLLVAAPLLITALTVGVVVSLLQAVTQIQEQTLTFIPKLIAVTVVLLITMPWMLRRLVEYVAESLRSLSVIAS